MSSYIVILGGFLTRRGLRNSLHWFLMLKEMEAPLQLSYCALTKEYVYISKSTDSTPPASSKHLPTQPLPALSAVYSNYCT